MNQEASQEMHCNGVKQFVNDSGQKQLKKELSAKVDVDLTSYSLKDFGRRKNEEKFKNPLGFLTAPGHDFSAFLLQSGPPKTCLWRLASGPCSASAGRASRKHFPAEFLKLFRK